MWATILKAAVLGSLFANVLGMKIYFDDDDHFFELEKDDTAYDISAAAKDKSTFRIEDMDGRTLVQFLNKKDANSWIQWKKKYDGTDEAFETNSDEEGEDLEEATDIQKEAITPKANGRARVHTWNEQYNFVVMAEVELD
ncbi:Uu.00g021700.m01.CDS01 [Anthostomella pinea]|uniref:Uu.00g021700.m01.CDS01 n=1 Tax=Anthostomella pinea TaxID=933095 RepID=A0AAI8VTW2_9PEZI|nr:Uu.00g021700.m01.CDS01 [Anthostomella pinea]